MNTIKFVWITGIDTFKVVLANEEQLSTELEVISSGGAMILDKITQDGRFVYITSQNQLDFRDNYYIQHGQEHIYAYFTKEVLNEYFRYEGHDLGVVYSQDRIDITIWSPPATAIDFLLFDKLDPEKLLNSYSLIRQDQGIYKLTIKLDEVEEVDDFHKYLYQLEVTAHGKKRLALDPYAKSMNAFVPQTKQVAKAAIIDQNRATPEGFPESKIDNAKILKDQMSFIGYEMHVRDFTIDPKLDVPDKIKGTYQAVTKKIGHLKNLGISHVQLLPIQSCYTTDETNRSYQSETVETDLINYNWGYDAHHYFIPEGWYSTDPFDPAKRIIELKEMIEALHQNDIGVIMDVVYNHTYKAAIFEHLAPGCYLRMSEEGIISKGTGAGESLESRTFMVKRLIIDSLKYYCTEFHVNGFRFDLMSFLDHQTMKEIRAELGDDVILYGEGWDLTDLPRQEATTKINFPPNISLGIFNDTTRDSLIGNAKERGFVQGQYNLGAKVRSGIIAGIKNYSADYNGDGHTDVLLDKELYHLFALEPSNTINYVSCHDGFTLWDKINYTIHTEIHFRKKLIKLALAMLLTSQGKVVLEGGVEIGRSKPLAPNDPTKDRAHTSSSINEESGINYFHENSYRSPDFTNMFRWPRNKDFADLFDYVKGLIKLRKNLKCLRYTNAEFIKKGLRFICEAIPNTENFAIDPKSRHKDWSNVETLNIHFLGGPANSKRYLFIDQLEVKSDRYITFDRFGRSSFTISAQELEQLKASVQFNEIKVRLTPSFDDLNGSAPYHSDQGFSTIVPAAVNLSTNLTTIDLSIMDNAAGKQELQFNEFIAFTLDNTLEQIDEQNDLEANYQKVLVIHNSSKSYIELEIQDLVDFACHHILVDNQDAGVIPLTSSAVTVFSKSIKVPGKTSSVIGLFN
ncbi:MAG: hypothetical protein ISR65_11455 [Bacteriovoracaceae bacterium]|nr:hypothetical protein [Bacteriovoracaceae bacterium]